MADMRRAQHVRESERDCGEVIWGLMIRAVLGRLNVVCDWRVWRRNSEGIAMQSHRLTLVKDSLDLLRQVRSSVASGSNHSLVVSLDEVIVRLELYVSSGVDDPGWIRDALKVLAQGLAMIPILQHLIDMLRNQ